MTEANDQPTAFDQDLYDQTMECPERTSTRASWDYGLRRTAYEGGYLQGAANAARIAAERAKPAPVPSDEALGAIFADALEVEHKKGPATSKAVLGEQVMAGIRAVREALTAAPGNALEVPNVPEIPEGWWVDELKAIHDLDGTEWIIREFRARVNTRDSERSDRLKGSTATGPTWQEALAAAIAATKATTEDESHGRN